MARGQLYTIKTKRRRVKKGRLLFLMALCGFLVTILFSVRFLEVLSSLQDKSDWAQSLPQAAAGKREHVLLYAVSDRETEGQAADVVLVAYHPQKKDSRIIHLPINTKIELEEGNVITLGRVYSQGGTELLVQTVSKLLNVPVHYYIEIDEDSLPRIVDKVGGISLPSEITMGNGSDILKVIYAEGLAISERLERRRRVLAALTTRIVSGNWWQKVKHLNRAAPLISTNLSWRKLLLTMDALKNTSFKETTHIILLPGSEVIEPANSYWQADSRQLPILASWLSGDFTSVLRNSVTVEVLNGCGIKGAATTIAGKLEAEGFNVVKIDNADHYNYNRSQVICRVKDADGAREVAVLIPGADLVKEEIPGHSAMVTVIVGHDYTANQ